jgi:hypothetical protein
VIGVDARTPSDIQEAVKFVREHNLRLVIKNTGWGSSFIFALSKAGEILIYFPDRHDYLGRSSGRGSFLIWTHHMKNITFHNSFTPTDATDSATYDHGSYLILQ